MKVKFSSERAAREFMESRIKDVVDFDMYNCAQGYQYSFALDMQLHLYFDEFTISYCLNWGEDVVSAYIKPTITENRIKNITALKNHLGMFDVLATKGEVIE